MARVFLDFEDSLIDINNVKSVDRNTAWDDKEERVMFQIVINNPNRVNIDSFLPHYTFKYASEQNRDIIFQELRDKLEEKGCEFI